MLDGCWADDGIDGWINGMDGRVDEGMGGCWDGWMGE